MALTTNKLFWEKPVFPPVCLLYCLTTFLTPEVGFFPTRQFYVTPAECPTIQLNADASYLESVSDPTG